MYKGADSVSTRIKCEIVVGKTEGAVAINTDTTKPKAYNKY